MCGVNAQRPRQRRRPAEQFLVEVVAEPADRLRQDQAGCDGVGERRQFDASAFAADPRAERAEGDRSPDAQAAVPDVEGLPAVAPGHKDGFPVLFRGSALV